MDVLVDADWLADHLGGVVLADVRWYLDGRDGRAAYESGHIPSAVFVDLDADLSGPGDPTDGRHPLPSPGQFAAAMGRLGIGTDDTVVAYDDSGGGTAGRFVWMLRVTGHDAALLDGGLPAWPGQLETGPSPSRPMAPFVARPWPAAALADADGTADAAKTGAVLDARSIDRFRGENETIDRRPGHIPGARSAHWTANLDPVTGRFLPPSALRARFEALGVRAGREIVAYCGSGVSACANLVALERAGFAGARLYVPSWSGWSADPDRAAATGD
ncbi:MAG TPA: sulfurtransferase [Acidimicrobiales bacterium]|nr:sulfurtransferase [Acidimicrobiales bacterium]